MISLWKLWYMKIIHITTSGMISLFHTILSNFVPIFQNGPRFMTRGIIKMNYYATTLSCKYFHIAAFEHMGRFGASCTMYLLPQSHQLWTKYFARKMEGLNGHWFWDKSDGKVVRLKLFSNPGCHLQSTYQLIASVNPQSCPITVKEGGMDY